MGADLVAGPPATIIQPFTRGHVRYALSPLFHKGEAAILTGGDYIGRSQRPCRSMEERHPYLRPENGLLFRITHESNLPFILRHGLVCPNHALRDPHFRPIANADVDEKRERHPVPVPPGGVLHDYVPFYFAPRSPMLGSIFSTQRCPQEEIIYLGTRVAKIQAAGLPFVFTSGHAIMAYSTWHHQVADLADAIDWPLMRATYWHDTPQDNDRMRRRMAEFLVKGEVPLSLIGALAVQNEPKKAQVEALLHTQGLSSPVVIVRSDWYF